MSAVYRHDDSGQLSLDALWWGHRLHWVGDKAPQPINATVEKVATSPYFRGAFAHHRCLVPANGWYEWLTEEGRKQPRRERLIGLTAHHAINVAENGIP